MKKTFFILIFAVAAQFHLAGQGISYSTGDKKEIQSYKLQQFYNYLNDYYVDTLNNEKLVEDAIIKILAELDPHSSYSSAEEMKAISESFEGSFSGIGVEFDVLNDTLTVVNTITGGPSERVGVMANDKIISVDGEPVIGISRTRVPKVLRGPKGTVVNIVVLRRGVSKPLSFRITRDNIPINTIDAAYMADGTTGYIKVNRFAETTMREFREAYGKLGPMEAMILDLRGNGGGLLGQAIELSEFFLPAGSLIVSTEGRNIPDFSHTSRRGGTFAHGKLVVLIDSSSASGSEIVAGAIQDWDRGIIIGQPSFGKGLVQRQVPLIDGSAVRITVARYHTPSGRVIQRPYEQGQTEEYYLDHIKRTYDSSYADSVNAKAPVYETLRSKRKVIGGGGINPDILIPLDTSANYSYWNRLVRAGVVNQYINTYLENERITLQRKYSDFESFAAEYKVTSAMMESMAEMGRKQGVEYDAAAAEVSMKQMNIHIKALVAQKLWSTTEYYRVINGSDDEDFAKALEAIADWSEYSKILNAK